MRDSAFDPPALPDAFWVRARRPPALADQRHRRPVPAGEQARRDQPDQDRHRRRACPRPASAWSPAASRRSANWPCITRIADGLGMPDHARIRLGIAPASQPPAPARGQAGRGDAGAGRRAAAPHLQRPLHRRRRRSSVLQDETDTIRLLDRRLGAPAVAAKLDAHIAQLQDSLHHSLTPGRRQQLALVLADAAALAGWQAIDTGRLPAAWDHFETATAAAREAGNMPCSPSPPGNRPTSCSTSASPPRPWRRSAPPATRPAPASPASSAAGSTPPRPRWPPPPASSRLPHRPRPRRPPDRPARRRASCPTSRSMTPTWPAGAATASSTSATRPPSPT